MSNIPDIIIIHSKDNVKLMKIFGAQLQQKI